MSLTGTLDMLWADNERLRARVESQRLVIEDLRRELELTCRRIVELEKGDAALNSAAKAMADAIHDYLAQSWIGPVTVDAIRAAKDAYRELKLERGSEDGA